MEARLGSYLVLVLELGIVLELGLGLELELELGLELRFGPPWDVSQGVGVVPLKPLVQVKMLVFSFWSRGIVP